MMKDLTQYGVNITAFGIATTIGGIVLVLLGRNLNE